jgi:capsid assembly protease
MKDRTAREVKANYRAELEQRMGIRPFLCEMDAIGFGSDKRKPYQVAEGVAIIDITGVLTNDAWWWDETEYGDIQDEVALAVEDADVTAILLRVNSPGGETDNAFETARALMEARKQKPMWAIADNIAYSAGFLLAATAETIYVPQYTGGVGSIGVYSAHFSYEEALKQAGIEVTLTSAGKGKTDGNRYERLSPAAKAKIKGEVDRLYSLFVGSVSKGRKIDEAVIREMGAALFQGSEAAIASGLADKTGSFEDAWVALAEHTKKKSNNAFAMSASAGGKFSKEGHMAETTTPAETKKPEQAAGAAVVDTSADTKKLVADAKAEGFAEAGEIADLCVLAGDPTKVRGYLADVRTGKKTVTAVREELVNAKAEAGKEGGEISNASLPSTAASKDEKPKQSTAERMKAKFGKGAA